MRHYKLIDGGYILAIGEGNGGEEITRAEYETILAAIHALPEAPAGKGYRLKTDLTAEAYDLPAEPTETDISDSEALSIILGGGEG